MTKESQEPETTILDLTHEDEGGYLLSIDPGTRNLGWAIVDQDGIVVASKRVDAIGKGAKYEHGRVMRRITHIIEKLKQRYPRLDSAVVEKQMVSDHQKGDYHNVIQGAIMSSCANAGLAIDCLATSSTKAHMRKQGFDWPIGKGHEFNKRQAVKIVRQMGLRVKTNHECDAILQGLTYLARKKLEGQNTSRGAKRKGCKRDITQHRRKR